MSVLWEKEEMILSLDFYLKHRPKMPSKKSEELKKLLSDIHIVQKFFNHNKQDLRTIDSIHMRNSNYQSVDPSASQGGLPAGGKKCQPIWDEFCENWKSLYASARGIREYLINDKKISVIKDTYIDEDFEIAQEGKLLTKVHLERERDKKIVKLKKKKFKEANGSLFCEACNLNFEKKYGVRGLDYIECHHTRPLSEGPGRTHIAHLRLLCSNCHKMVHRKKPWLSFEELKKIIMS